MKLHEEFKLYENMWDDYSAEPLEEKKAKPYTKRKMAHAAIAGLSHLILSALPGVSIANIGLTLLASNIIVDIFEAIDYHKVTKNYPGIKQLVKKSSNLRREIFSLIDEAGVEKAAECLEHIDQYIMANPQILEDDTIEAILDIAYDPDAKTKTVELALAGDNAPVPEEPFPEFAEALAENVDSLNMSMNDFLKALSEMRAEYGDDCEVDVNEINNFMKNWKAQETVSRDYQELFKTYLHKVNYRTAEAYERASGNSIEHLTLVDLGDSNYCIEVAGSRLCSYTISDTDLRDEKLALRYLELCLRAATRAFQA